MMVLKRWWGNRRSVRNGAAGGGRDPGSELFLGEIAEGFQGGGDGVVPRESAVHAEAVFVTVLHREERAGGGGDAVLQGLAVEAQGVDAGGQFDPEDEAAFGAAEAGAFGEVAEDGLREEVQLAVIRAADGAEVMVVAAVAEEIGDGFLEDDGSAERVGKLETADAFEVAAGGAPADAEGRGEGFCRSCCRGGRGRRCPKP
jgi:hypothetical protein